MKTRIFLLSALAAFSLSACQKEGDPQIEEESGAPGVMTINFVGNDTRATGAGDVATETKIKKGVIIVFKGTGSNPAVDSKTAFDFTTAPLAPVRVNLTQGNRQIYVIANVTPSDFDGVHILSELQHITNKLTLANFRTDGALPMSGYKLNVNTVGSTAANPVSTSVALKFIGSRVHVDWDLNASLSGMTISGAVFLNVNAKSEYIATPIDASSDYALTNGFTDYLQGIGDVSTFMGSYKPTAAMTNLNDPALMVAAADKGFANNHTYVFENSSLQQPVIVAIKGIYAGKSYYWPVVINGPQNTSGGNGTFKVVRGTIYNVKATINGMGSEDPYEPIVPGAMDIQITTASWVASFEIDQTFN